MTEHDLKIYECLIEAGGLKTQWEDLKKAHPEASYEDLCDYAHQMVVNALMEAKE